MTTTDKLAAALREERRVRLLGQEPDIHWESLRDVRRACYAHTDAALAEFDSQRQQAEAAQPAAGGVPEGYWLAPIILPRHARMHLMSGEDSWRTLRMVLEAPQAGGEKS